MHTTTLQKFNRLSNPEKWAIIEDDGVYLDVYLLEGSVKICLFALFNYYVEVHYHQVKDKLIKALAFSSYKKLDPFLKSIDITPLYAAL